MKPPGGPIDRLVTLARDATPPPLSEADAERLVRRALAAARRAPTHAAPVRRPWRLALAVAATAVLALGGGWWWRGRGVQAGVPLQATLSTGDRLQATPGTRFEVRSLAPEDRRFVLHEGTVLFEVPPLRDGQRFEVQTGQLVVRVRGTVFSVSAHPGRSVVQVFEGRVEVEEAGRPHLLSARQQWTSGTPQVAALGAEPLRAQGQAAARRRMTILRAPTQPISASPGSPALAQMTPASPQRVVDPGPAPPEPVPVPIPSRAARSGVPVPTWRETPRAPGPEELRAWMATGRFEEALAAARAAGRTTGTPDPWGLLEADALRGLARFAEAADAYERAAATLPADRAAPAGYAAAFLRLRQLGDPAGALRALDATQADAAGSPLEERALVLRARALHQAGREDEARAVAQRYLSRHPSGGMAAWMRALAGEP